MPLKPDLHDHVGTAQRQPDPAAFVAVEAPVGNPFAPLEAAFIDGASIIARRENIRQISVRPNIRGRDQGSFVKEAQQEFARAVKLPAGYSVA